LPRLDALAVAQAAGPQMRVQLGQVARPRHRGGPVALQVTHAPLDVRLLLRPTHQAEERLEGVVTDQGLVAVVETALAAGKQLRRDGLGVVPPYLTGHTVEEGKGFDQAVQDGLGALGRQGDREGTVGVGPGHQQHRDEAAAVGEIDVDVAEVGLQALARIVVERDERLALSPALGEEVEPDALIAAGVAVLVAQAAEDLGGGVLLLARGLLVGPKDGVDDRLEGIDDRGHGAALVGSGFRLGEDLADLAPRVVEPAGQLADAHVLQTVGLSNACVLVHGDHPPPPVRWAPLW
jgi:hypothetical protein